MAEGTVRWYDDWRGFGFISVDESLRVYVHYPAIQGDFKALHEGQMVVFDVIQGGPKGLSAANVREIG